MKDVVTRNRGKRKTPLKRIDDFLEKEQAASNAEIIRRMRAEYFVDVDALQASGKVTIPE